MKRTNKKSLPCAIPFAPARVPWRRSSHNHPATLASAGAMPCVAQPHRSQGSPPRPCSNAYARTYTSRPASFHRCATPERARHLWRRRCRSGACRPDAGDGYRRYCRKPGENELQLSGWGKPNAPDSPDPTTAKEATATSPEPGETTDSQLVAPQEEGKCARRLEHRDNWLAQILPPCLARQCIAQASVSLVTTPQWTSLLYALRDKGGPTGKMRCLQEVVPLAMCEMLRMLLAPMQCDARTGSSRCELGGGAVCISRIPESGQHRQSPKCTYSGGHGDLRPATVDERARSVASCPKSDRLQFRCK